MTKATPGIKIQYLKEEQYPEPVGLRCVKVMIPDSDEFLAVLAGMINIASKGFNYQRWDYEKAQRLAQLWRNAYNATDWDNCMSCEEVADCIENDEDVQDALTQHFYNNTTTFPYNPETVTNLLPKAFCDKDTAAGYIKTGIVDRAVQNIIDMFQILEATTNDEEILDAFIDLIPVGGALLDEIMVFDIPVYVNSIREWITEQFEAEDTTAIREETYRDLLCIFMEDCSISTDEIRDYFWQKATQANPSFNSALDTAVDLFNFLINGTISNFDGIWYVMMATQFGIAYFINELFGMSLSKFKLLAQLGDPTDDWIAWEIEYGECTCMTIYSNPDNPIPNIVPIVGLIGIQNVIMASGILDTGFGDTSWTIAEIEVDVTDAVLIEYVVDEPGLYAAIISSDTVDYLSGVPGNLNVEAYYIAENKWGIPIELPNVTDTLTSINFRRAPTGVVNDYLWIQLRVHEVC